MMIFDIAAIFTGERMLTKDTGGGDRPSTRRDRSPRVSLL
jgi:hypothetical protein